jgi:peptidyl-dipeptidase A
MIRTKLIFIVLPLIFLTYMCKNNSEKMGKDLKNFIVRYDSIVLPVLKGKNLADWKASISGKEVDFIKSAEYEKKYIQILSNKVDFKKLEDIKSSNYFGDSIISRELDVIYLQYLSNQADSALLQQVVDLEKTIEQKYNNFRAVVNGKKLTDNEVEDILQKSNDSNLLQQVWEAHKKIGPLVANDIITLVKKRNEIAKQLGFSNYHEMSLRLNDQDSKSIEKLFDELDLLTQDSYAKVKAEIDSALAKENKIDISQLRPWHYKNRYFQEAPKIYTLDLDKYFANKNLVKITENYYASIGLPINDILPKCDLYEKPGKNQHAYCTDIDYEGDIRVLCNIKPNSYWMNTMLHEFGHAVYDKNIDRSLPFVIRQPAHIFTTEGIAMLFGRLPQNAQWIQDMTGISDKEKNKISNECYKSLRMEELVFSRWVQVMYRFEKGMYENPDQDLNKLWWTLAEKYQMIKKPEGRNEPDWATKIHIATSPCYYHNYLLGELFASQIHYYICEKILKDTTNHRMISYYNKPEVGEFLKTKIFYPGARYYWNDMIERATGEKLTAKYYAKQFVE